MSLKNSLSKVKQQATRPMQSMGAQVALAGARILPPSWIESAVQRLMGERLGLFRAAWVAALHHPHHLGLPRFEARELDQMASWARRRFPEADYFLLSDLPEGAVPYGFPGLEVKRLERVDQAPPSDHPRVFFCVYSCDGCMAEVLREINRLDNAFYYTPKAYMPTARFFQRDCKAHEVMTALVPSADDLDTYDLADHENIVQALARTRDLPGDYVEMGVYRGSSAELAMSYLERAEIQRHGWFLDLYEGFSYDAAAESPDAFWLGQFQGTSMERVAQRLERFENKSLVRCNVVTDELPAGIEQIAVCNIDVDLYEAVMAGLAKVTPRMVSGGVVLVEDQGHTPNIAGGYLAVEDFLASELGQQYWSWNLTSGQALLIKI